MNAILENVLAPLVRRLGTAAAVWLVAQGADSVLVEQLVNGLSAALLVGVDLLLARFYRRAVVTKVASSLVADVRGGFGLGPKGGA